MKPEEASLYLSSFREVVFSEARFEVLREFSQPDVPRGIPVAHPQDRREPGRGIFRDLGLLISRLVVTATNPRLGFEREKRGKQQGTTYL